MEDQVRVKFEEWFEQNPANREALTQWREGVGYRADAYYLNGCWQGWQAATDECVGNVKALRAALNECLLCLSGEYDTDSAHQHAMDLARAALKGDKP